MSKTDSFAAALDELRGHSFPDVADRLDVSVKTVRRMVAAGELTTIRFAGRTVRVTEDSLRALFAFAGEGKR